MNRWLCGIWAAGVACGLESGCSRATEAPGASAKKMAPVAVRTAIAERRDISETLLFTGELESPLSVEVVSKAQGRIERLDVAEGSEVRRGQVIAEIDRRELQAREALAEAQVRQADVTAADRARERRRIEALFGENVATEQARDAIVTAHETALAALAQAQAQLDLARVNLDETALTAPMDGVVAARQADPGAMAGPGTPVARIVQMDPLRLMLAIPARLLPMLEEGKTEVAISTDAQPDGARTGKLARIFPTVDVATRTVRAEVALPNPKENGAWALRPGMYATARLTLATSPGALVVPASSVVRALDRKLVFVVREDAARATDVVTGIRDGADLEIVDGLAEGDEYVAMGQNKLTDGAPIERVGAFGAPAAEAAK